MSPRLADRKTILANYYNFVNSDRLAYRRLPGNTARYGGRSLQTLSKQRRCEVLRARCRRPERRQAQAAQTAVSAAGNGNGGGDLKPMMRASPRGAVFCRGGGGASTGNCLILRHFALMLALLLPVLMLVLALPRGRARVWPSAHWPFSSPAWRRVRSGREMMLPRRFLTTFGLAMMQFSWPCTSKGTGGVM